MTGVYLDLVLTTTVRSISRHAVPYVMITATDPRDKVFLASIISKHCPESRILMTTGDQIYTHSDYAQFLAGSYVASSYPIFPRLLAPTGGDKTPLQLPAFGEQQVFSYYNAVSMQLDKTGALLYYTNVHKCAPALFAPSAWICQVGLERAHILCRTTEFKEFPSLSKTLWQPDDPTTTMSPPQKIELSRPNMLWTIWLCGCDVVLLIVAVLTRRKMALITKVACARMGMLIVVHAVVIMAALALAGFALGIFYRGYRPYDSGLEFPSASSPSVSRVASTAVVIMIGIALALMCMEVRFLRFVSLRTRRHDQSPSHVQKGRFLFGSWLLCGLLGLAVGALAMYLASARQTSWSLARIQDMRDGTSPFVPYCLLLAILLCWCLLHWNRVEWLDKFDADWDPLNTKSPPPARGNDQVEGARDEDAEVYRACEEWNVFPWYRATQRKTPDARPGGDPLGHRQCSFNAIWGQISGSCKKATTFIERLFRADTFEENESATPKLKVNWYFVAGLGIVVYGQVLISNRWLPCPDGAVVTWLRGGFCVCGWLIVSEVGKLWRLWTALEQLHHTVARLPMQHAFSNT